MLPIASSFDLDGTFFIQRARACLEKCQPDTVSGTSEATTGYVVSRRRPSGHDARRSLLLVASAVGRPFLQLSALARVEIRFNDAVLVQYSLQ